MFYQQCHLIDNGGNGGDGVYLCIYFSAATREVICFPFPSRPELATQYNPQARYIINVSPLDYAARLAGDKRNA